MTKGYKMSASTGIHRGDREYQQDQVQLIRHPNANGCVLAILADGMGGRTGGRKASDQVMLTARQLFERYDPNTDDTHAFLKQVVDESNLVIRMTAVSSEQEPHSTLAAFLVNPQGDCHWVHCGDSRIYHFRGDRLIHRTKDHSYVQTLVDKGELTEEQASSHPQSNMLMGCLGTPEEPPLTHHYIAELGAGDTLMSCSDGVWHYFKSEEMGPVLSALSPRESSEFLIDTARSRARGGGDNLSLAIVKFEELDPEPPKGIADLMSKPMGLPPMVKPVAKPPAPKR